MINLQWWLIRIIDMFWCQWTELLEVFVDVCACVSVYVCVCKIAHVLSLELLHRCPVICQIVAISASLSFNAGIGLWRYTTTVQRRFGRAAQCPHVLKLSFFSCQTFGHAAPHVWSGRLQCPGSSRSLRWNCHRWQLMTTMLHMLSQRHWTFCCCCECTNLQCCCCSSRQITCALVHSHGDTCFQLFCLYCTSYCVNELQISPA